MWGRTFGRAVVAVFWMAGLAAADVQIPTATTVFFEQNGQPYRRPVSFTVRCFGWTTHPGEPSFRTGQPPEPYTPQLVFSFSGQCPDYGCQVNDPLYLNYRHIEYCDLEGQSEGRRFRVPRYGSHPVTRCQEPGAGNRFERRCELRIALPAP